MEVDTVMDTTTMVTGNSDGVITTTEETDITTVDVIQRVVVGMVTTETELSINVPYVIVKRVLQDKER